MAVYRGRVDNQLHRVMFPESRPLTHFRRYRGGTQLLEPEIDHVASQDIEQPGVKKWLVNLAYADCQQAGKVYIQGKVRCEEKTGLIFIQLPFFRTPGPCPRTWGKVRCVSFASRK
jgi:hypothetical protein